MTEDKFLKQTKIMIKIFDKLSNEELNLIRENEAFKLKQQTEKIFNQIEAHQTNPKTKAWIFRFPKHKFEWIKARFLNNG